jgi:hypothetical protein
MTSFSHGMIIIRRILLGPLASSLTFHLHDNIEEQWIAVYNSIMMVVIRQRLRKFLGDISVFLISGSSWQHSEIFSVIYTPFFRIPSTLHRLIGSGHPAH